MSVPFDKLNEVDLVAGETYRGGDQPHVGADPISKLLSVGNMGGFRIAGSPGRRNHRVALFTTQSESEWPDRIDAQNALLIYYGDNRGGDEDFRAKPGNALMEHLLRSSLESRGPGGVGPPFFVFSSTGAGRDVRFEGLAAFGSDSCEDLVALWRHVDGRSFLNYRGAFTILDAPVIRRRWIDAMAKDEGADDLAPLAWQRWRDRGQRIPLREEWVASR